MEPRLEGSAKISDWMGDAQRQSTGLDAQRHVVNNEIHSAFEVAKSAVWTQATPRVAAGTRGVGFPKARKGSPACGPSRREARPCPKPKKVTHAAFHAPRHKQTRAREIKNNVVSKKTKFLLCSVQLTAGPMARPTAFQVPGVRPSTLAVSHAPAGGRGGCNTVATAVTDANACVQLP